MLAHASICWILSYTVCLAQNLDKNQKKKKSAAFVLKPFFYSFIFYWCSFIQLCMCLITVFVRKTGNPIYVTQYNKRYILSTFEIIEMFALSNRRFAFQWYQIRKKMNWYLWKYNFYKVCISFYFLYILHTNLFIISE